MAKDITPERWQQIVRLFEAALELNASERAAFLAEACAGDEAVGREVESLLSQVDSSTERGIGGVAAMFGARSSDKTGSSPANDTEASHDLGDSKLFESVSLFGGVDDVRYAPGRMVASRYRIVSLIGRGAMGEVYRADDLKVGQAVALKFAPPEVSRDPRWVARFTREVRLARQVSHPNVCRVYDIGEAEGRHYLSMEYIDGENLQSLLQRIGRLPFEKAVDIARQLCAGLAAAHDSGILHRDLKPANIMIDGRGRARITDFGLAMPVQRRRTREIAGTPAYMAPEQVAGGIVTEQSDLFSLGLILYELLTGKRLLEATTLQERWITQRDGQDPRIMKSHMSADVDRGVALVIGRCLEHEPARRPASAREIAAALPGGGDPLAAALAAGEIPSPEMVAAAGGATGLRSPVAWGCLGFTLVGLLVAALNLPSMMLYRQVTLEKPPDALIERAQQIMGRVGLSDRPADRVYWFVSTGTRLFQGAMDRVALYDPFEAASGLQPERVFFVYRQSPHRFAPRGTFGVVRYRDPPADVPGMADVILDPLGRLVRFTSVPGAARPSDRWLVDWTVAFAEAGLDIGRFRRTESGHPPLFAHDTFITWQGGRPDGSTAPLYVTAAAWRGQPVFFDVAEASRDMLPIPASPAPRGRPAEFLLAILTFATLIPAGMLARRNILQGRWDGAGVLKLGAYLLATDVLLGLLRAHHIPAVRDEYLLIIKVTGWSLYLTAILCLIYIAFEPAVRERWPHLLIGWTRLLAGRFRDRVVGRDVLVGAFAGVASILLRETGSVVSSWLRAGTTKPFSSSLDSLGPWTHLVSGALSLQTNAVIFAVGNLLILLLLRIVLRSDTLAVVTFTGILATINTFSGDLLVFPWALLTAVMSSFLLLRFGLLAWVVAILYSLSLSSLPISLNPSDWYMERSVVILLALAGLATFGFYTSHADRSLARRSLREPAS